METVLPTMHISGAHLLMIQTTTLPWILDITKSHKTNDNESKILSSSMSITDSSLHFKPLIGSQESYSMEILELAHHLR